MKKRVRITGLPKAQVGGGIDQQSPYVWSNNGQGKSSPTWEGTDLTQFKSKFVTNDDHIPRPDFVPNTGLSKFITTDDRIPRNNWEMKSFDKEALMKQKTMNDYYINNSPDSNIYRQEDSHYSTSPMQQPVPNDNIVYAKYGGSLDQKNYALDRGNYYADYGKADSAERDTKDSLAPVPRDQANLEAENGEMAFLQGDDGQLKLFRIGGERHSNGGTPLDLPNGAFIFSDTAKMKMGGDILTQFGKNADSKKKYTPADLAKQYPLNVFIDKKKDPTNDKFANDTADLMLNNHKMKLGALAIAQEQKKEFPNGIPTIVQQIAAENQEERGESPQAQQQQQADPAEPPMARYGGSMRKYDVGGDIEPKRYMGSNTPQGGITPTKQSSFFNSGNEYFDGYKNVIPGIDNMNTSQAQGAIYDYNMGSVEGQQRIADMWTAKGLNNHGRSQSQFDGMTNNGVFKPGMLNSANLGSLRNAYTDGMWGGRTIQLPQNNHAIPYNTGIDQNIAAPFENGIPTVPVNSSTVATGNKNIATGTANFNNTPQSQIPFHAMDMMNTAHAWLKPIEHTRPQLIRTDAMISAPTFGDNRAAMQNFQSIAATNAGVIQNTSNGQAARAQMMATSGKMFDGMNQSNEQMQNGNVAISNAWNQQRDSIMNANNQSNNQALSNFITSNDRYRGNLREEKDLKFKDAMDATGHMLNNRDQMAALVARTPNFSVKDNWWTPQYVGRQGDLLTGNGQQSQDPFAIELANYKKARDAGFTHEESQDIAFSNKSFSKTVDKKDATGRLKSQTVTSGTR